MNDEPNEPQMMIFGGNASRRGGRPRVAQPRSSVSTWLWATHHDALVKIAQKNDVSVSAVVRGILSAAITKKRG